MAQFMATIQEARVSGADILGLASRVWFAPSRARPEPLVESAIWAGSHSPPTKPLRLTEAQLAEAAELLKSGASYPAVAARLSCSVSTLRYYVSADVGKRRVPATYPTEAARYQNGTVRWDKPMRHGRSNEVLVECQCGRERYIATHQVARAGREFTAGCVECFPFTPYLGEPLLKPEQVIEAAAMRNRGCSWTEFGRRFDVNRHTVRRAVEGLLLTSPLPCSGGFEHGGAVHGPVRKEPAPRSPERPRGKTRLNEPGRPIAAAQAASPQWTAPAPGWSNGDRLATGEANEWAQFQERMAQARASGVDPLAAPLRIPSPSSLPKPAVWTGPTDDEPGSD